jgi:hypothetical protein
VRALVHCGVDVKRLGLSAGILAMLAVAASVSAFALEEQRAPVAPQTPAAEAPAAAVQDGTVTAKPETGTEIRIPGLGKLGTLPKMDFGLELLYGASEDKAAQDPVPEDPNQDLTIRGSVKHRF